MLPRSFSRFRRAAIVRTAVLSLTFVFIAADAFAGPLNFTVGSAQVVYTAKQRKQRKVDYWPDGNFGVVNNGNGTYDFYAANGPSPVKTTSASLTDPGLNKKAVVINGIPKNTFNYVAGGPVYRDAASGARIMVYHAEKHFGSSQNYYSVLGLAVSTEPTGTSFRDLGTIIEPNAAAGQLSHSIDIGGGSFAVVDNYLNVYYRDYMTNGSSSELAVARASLPSLINNALSGQYTQFWKYYNGNWTEQGVRGMSSPLEVGNPANAWSAVSYNDHLNQVVMVSSQWSADGGDLYMASSPDGVNWSPRQTIAVDPGEQFYPSIVGTGADPNRTGQSFYVYYTDSKKGAWDRWSDASLARRQITFNSLAPPVPTPTPTPTPPPATWATVGDFASDFQTGNPAAGWKYAWNSTGKLGNSAVFTPLMWSAAAQAYNTTGGASQEPAGKKTHNDDYLILTSYGGHPGRPGFLPIAGYTIQADDGAGIYRLFDTSIKKADGATAKSEDGLEVLVYLNNTLLGATQTVSTNGQLASFNRDLGSLNVGDTVWVMVNSAKNNSYDLFNSFDFSIQKSFPMPMLLQSSAVPEPSAVVLLMTTFTGLFLPRRPRRHTLAA